jgi:hypothetical protein
LLAFERGLSLFFPPKEKQKRGGEFADGSASTGKGDEEMRAAAAAAVRVVMLMCLISFLSHVDVADGRSVGCGMRFSLAIWYSMRTVSDLFVPNRRRKSPWAKTRARKSGAAREEREKVRHAAFALSAGCIDPLLFERC